MSGEGMVAVVQGLRDAGLAVTVLDGSRNSYSLLPNQGQASPKPPYQTIRLQCQSSSAGTDSTYRCDSSAQATDGRYASVYQTTHGNVSPTSPPVQVTEFPPQRAELCPGKGNFEVGGLGSGETGRCAIRPQQQGQFRGGLNWVDRGSVCSPRPSQHMDAFASSLRKYPTLTTATSEMVERLITYSQAKNFTRNQSKGTSPVRTPIESEVSHNTYTRRGGQGDSRARSRMDEYPTRDTRPRREEYDRRPYNRNYDIRFARDSRAKDFAKACNFNHQHGMTEGLDSPSYHQRRFPDNTCSNSVHTETQAVVEMVSKEVATVPKSEPVKKNVAVPHGSSTSVGNTEGAVSDLPNPSQVDQIPSKIVCFKAVQTTSSSIELISTIKQREARKSKSDDDLRKRHFQEGIIELIESPPLVNEASRCFRTADNSLEPIEYLDSEEEDNTYTAQKCVQTSFSATFLKTKTDRGIRKTKSDEDYANERILKDIIYSYRNVCKADDWGQRIEKKPTNIEHKMKKRLKKCLQLVSSQLSEFEDDTKQLKSDLTHIIVKKLTKMCLQTERERSYSPPIKIYRVEVPKYVAHENIEALKSTIENWLNVVPIKTKNSQGNNIEKKEIVHSLLKNLKPIVSNRYKDRKSYWYTLRKNILKCLEDLPVMTEKNNKKACINRYANMLVQGIFDMSNLPRDKTEDTDEKDVPVSTQNKPEPTKYDKVQLFVREEMFKFLRKVNLNYSDEVKDAETYLVNFLNAASSDVHELNNVEDDLSNVLQNVGKWPLNQANYFVNMLMRRFNIFLKTNLADKVETKNEQKVLYVSCGHNTMSYSKYHHIWPTFVNLDDYYNQYIDADNLNRERLTKVVNDWLTSVDFVTPTTYKNSFVNVAVSNLVEDIDRKRQYLNTSNYIQYVKFRILKWVSYNLGEDSNIIARASELVANILNISIPKFHNNCTIYQSATQPTATNLNDAASQNSSLLCEEQIVEIIFDWMHDLPADMHSTQNATLENQLIKDLAAHITKELENTDRNKIIDIEVDNWINIAFNRRPKKSIINILKKKIKEFPYVIENVSKDYKIEKNRIRRYEDIIDDWLNTIPIEPRRELDFAEMRMDVIHELAMKINKVKIKNSNNLADIVRGKLESNISDWLTKIPIHPRANRKSFRNQFANKLLRNIQKCNLDESVPEMEILNDYEWKLNMVRSAILNWLTETPIHKNSDLVTKKKQETIVNDFAKQYTSAFITGGDVNSVVKKCVQMLCKGTNYDDVFIENTYIQLQSHLNTNLAHDLSNKFELPNQITSNILGNVQREGPPLSSDIIFSAIFDWSSTLPLKHDYCPRSFKSLITDMSKEITKLIVHPEHSLVEENNEQMKQKIFEYVSKFPLRPDIKMEQICDMIADLWSSLKDINLYRDDDNPANITRENSMFDNNSAGISDNQINNNAIREFGPPGLGNSFKESTQRENEKRSSAPPVLKDKNANNNLPVNVSVMQNVAAENNPQLMNYNLELGPSGPGGSFREVNPREKARKMSAPAAVTMEKAKIVRPVNPEFADLQGMNRNQLLDHFQRIFTEYCQEIPMNTSTTENKILADSARQEILNGIWKAFCALLSNAEVADDYSYFRDLMEERLNGMLDIVLPQNIDTNRFKAYFIEKILRDLIRMLKYFHYLTDCEFMKTALAQRVNRQIARRLLNVRQDQRQHLFIHDIINEHLLYLNYKETDPIKANIYRKRLEKFINELIDYVRTVNRQQPVSQYMNENALRIYIHETLKSQPPLDEGILKDEVDEILVAQEIEQWFNNLPINPKYFAHEEYRRKLCEMLAHKIQEIEKKRLEPNDSNCDRYIKHEISKFLDNTTEPLKPDDCLNINEMVGELTNRLKNHRENRVIEYDTFLKENPACSTLAKIDPEDVFNANEITIQKPIEPVVSQEINMFNTNQNEHRPGILGTSQVAGPSQYVAPERPPSESYYQNVPQIKESLGHGYDVIQQYSQIHSDQNFGQTCNQCSPQCNKHQNMSAHPNVPATLNQSLSQTLGPQPQMLNRSLAPSNNIQNLIQLPNLPPPINQSMPGPQSQILIQSSGQSTRSSDQNLIQPHLPQNVNQSVGQSVIYISDQQPNAVPQQTQYLRPPEGSVRLRSQSDQRSRSGQGSRGTVSTARVTADQAIESPVEEDLGSEESRHRCRCLERLWRCRRRKPHCFPMPFSCRYFY